MKPGGISLKGDSPDERVDLINVCQIEGGAESGWKVTGYQGQLQEAWMRVVPVLKEGTKSGTVGLMGRNLSHNIGSHALYWIEQDETEREKILFYRYLRERMELLAGFATSMPLSATTANLKAVVDEMSENKLLWTNIARSEEVHSVSFVPEGCDRLVALPGGVIGKQAFFTIVENIVRDCAKFGRPGREMRVTISACDAPDDDHIQIVLYDDCGNAEHARTSIGSALEKLRISDEAGRLLPQHWGVKERFISAALLRGIRLETLEPIVSLGKARPANLPILDLVEMPTGDRKNLGWSWYLLKPKNILLIDGSHTGISFRAEEVNAQTEEWLFENLDDPSAIRHRFVILPGELLGRLNLSKCTEKLPGRLLWIGDTPPSMSRFGKFDGDELTSLTAYRQWLRHLLWGGRMPVIVFGDAFRKGRLKLKAEGCPDVYFWPNDDFESEETPWKSDGAPLIIFDRHGLGLNWALKQKPLLYEPHESNDPVRSIAGMQALDKLPPEELGLRALQLAEAALTRILVLDERLDESNAHKNYTGAATEITYKALFQMKGIDLAGSEYSKDKIPAPAALYSNIPDGVYDFALIHRGILDKLRAAHDISLKEVCSNVQSKVGQLIVHSGRMSMQELPPGVKFLPLSSVVAWFDQNFSKMQIVEELNLLRKVG